MTKARLLIGALAVLATLATTAAPAAAQAPSPDPPKPATECVRTGGEFEAETVRQCMIRGEDVILTDVVVRGRLVFDVPAETFAPGGSGDFTRRRRELLAFDRLEERLGVPIDQVRRIRGSFRVGGCSTFENGVGVPALTRDDPKPVVFEEDFLIESHCLSDRPRVVFDFRGARFTKNLRIGALDFREGLSQADIGYGIINLDEAIVAGHLYILNNGSFNSRIQMERSVLNGTSLINCLNRVTAHGARIEKGLLITSDYNKTNDLRCEVFSQQISGGRIEVSGSSIKAIYLPGSDVLSLAVSLIGRTKVNLAGTFVKEVFLFDIDSGAEEEVREPYDINMRSMRFGGIAQIGPIRAPDASLNLSEARVAGSLIIRASTLRALTMAGLNAASGIRMVGIDLTGRPPKLIDPNSKFKVNRGFDCILGQPIVLDLHGTILRGALEVENMRQSPSTLSDLRYLDLPSDGLKMRWDYLVDHLPSSDSGKLLGRHDAENAFVSCNRDKPPRTPETGHRLVTRLADHYRRAGNLGDANAAAYRAAYLEHGRNLDYFLHGYYYSFWRPLAWAAGLFALVVLAVQLVLSSRIATNPPPGVPSNYLASLVWMPLSPPLPPPRPLAFAVPLPRPPAPAAPPPSILWRERLAVSMRLTTEILFPHGIAQGILPLGCRDSLVIENEAHRAAAGLLFFSLRLAMLSLLFLSAYVLANTLPLLRAIVQAIVGV